MDTNILLVLADAILIVHAAFVAFVLFGLVLIYVGYFLKWSWVVNFWFRIFHLIAIGIVVLQSWLGVICPLTIWEMSLRQQAGDTSYSGSFVQHWLHSILYFTAPEWLFVLAYTIFGSLVLASWFVVKPIENGA